MFCANCGKEVHEGESFCAGCGTSIPWEDYKSVVKMPIADDFEAPKEETAAEEPTEEPVSTATEAPAEKVEEKVAETSAEEPVSAATETAVKLSKDSEKTSETAEGAADAGSVEDAEGAEGTKAPAGVPPKFRKPLIFAGLGAVVVLLICLVNLAQINNFCHKIFGSEADYYQFVEEKAAKELAGNLAAMYANYVLNYVDINNKQMNLQVSTEVGPEGEQMFDLISAGTNRDFSWIKKIDMSAELAKKDKLGSLEMALAVNKEKLMSVNFVVDAENNKSYLRLPEIASKTLCFEGNEKIGDVSEGINEVDTYKEVTPEAAFVEKMLAKYLMVAFKSIDDVKLKSKTLNVEGISQKCTEVRVSFTEETIEKIADAVETEMKADQELKKDFGEMLRVNHPDAQVDSLYDEFVEEVRENIRAMRRVVSDDKATMKVFVNSKGQIIGRDITFSERGREQTIAYKKLSKRGQFGYELGFGEENGPFYSLTGHGIENKSTLSGEFEFKSEDVVVAEFRVESLNKKELKQGLPNGKIFINPSAILYKELGINSRVIKDMVFALDMRTTPKTTKLVLDVMDKEEVKILTVKMDYAKKNAGSISVPNKVVTVTEVKDVTEWMKDWEFKSLYKKLDKIGAPDEYEETLEKFEDQAGEGALLNSLVRYYILSRW